MLSFVRSAFVPQSVPFLASFPPPVSSPCSNVRPPPTVPLPACGILLPCHSRSSTPAPTFQTVRRVSHAALKSTEFSGCCADPMRARVFSRGADPPPELPCGRPGTQATDGFSPCAVRYMVSGCFPFPEETGAAAATSAMSSATSSLLPELHRLSARCRWRIGLLILHLFFLILLNFWATESSSDRFTPWIIFELNLVSKFDSCTMHCLAGSASRLEWLRAGFGFGIRARASRQSIDSLYVGITRGIHMSGWTKKKTETILALEIGKIR